MSHGTRRISLLIAIMLAMLVTGCAIPVSSTRSVSTITSGSDPVVSFTVTGEIQEIASSSGIITLKQTLEGFTTVLMTDETAITGIDNQPLPFAQLKPGMRIEATGTTNGESAINAAQIRVTRIPPAAHAHATAVQPLSWQSVQIPQAGLAVEMPAGWAQRGIEWVWGNSSVPN